MKYIQRQDKNGVETVDEFFTSKEAQEMLKEYRLADSSAVYYISKKPTRDWRF